MDPPRGVHVHAMTEATHPKWCHKPLADQSRFCARLSRSEHIAGVPGQFGPER